MTDGASFPTDVAALFREALTRHAESRLAEAENLYRQVLERDPHHAQALGLLAMLLTDGPDEAAAEAILLRHLALRPHDGASLHGLGQLRARQGDDEAAVALFQRAAQWLPQLAPISNDLGVSLHRLERSEAALAALDRAIGVEPAYAAAHGNRGVVLFDLGRFDEAFDAQLASLLNADVRATEIRASALENLWRAARKAGRRQEAGALASVQVQVGELDALLADRLAQILDGSDRPG